MNRAEAAAYVGERLGAYLVAASRTAADSAGNLKPVIDDALRALGYAAAAVPTAAPSGEDAEEDFRVQLVYRTLLQVVRDLGPTHFAVGASGDSFALNQVRIAAEKDVALAEKAVLERFGTLGVVGGDGGAVWSIDLNFLADPDELAAAS